MPSHDMLSDGLRRSITGEDNSHKKSTLTMKTD
jgi:hypothetical protein